MSDRTGINWSKEETILAFELYCRTPFGKISRSNEEVIELASLLGRTPSSVALKMHNLAHYDPELISRNVTAMAHGSKLDGVVFKEFYQNIGELTLEASHIRSQLYHQDTKKLVDIDDLELIPPGKYKESVMKTRVGQYYFRRAVLNIYNNRCCVTGIDMNELLVASHIKPWSVSNEKTERTNPCNGLCLNSLHDQAFDKGLITISKDYKVIISNKLKIANMDETTKGWLFSYDKKQIMLPERFLPGREFIEYHNDVIFEH